jgi:hypothetical protein
VQILTARENSSVRRQSSITLGYPHPTMPIPTLRDAPVGQRVHPHGNREVLQVVEELAKLLELLEAHALLLHVAAVQQPVQVVVVLFRVQVRVAEQNFREIRLGYFGVTLRELVKLQLEHLRLQVLHEAVEAVKVEVLVALFAEKVDLEGRVDLVTSLEA